MTEGDDSGLLMTAREENSTSRPNDPPTKQGSPKGWPHSRHVKDFMGPSKGSAALLRLRRRLYEAHQGVVFKWNTPDSFPCFPNAPVFNVGWTLRMHMET